MAAVHFIVIVLAVFVPHQSDSHQSDFYPPKTLEGIQQFLSALVSNLTTTATTTTPEYSQQTDEGWGTGRCDQNCSCGQANRMVRIVGGSPTLVNEYPWVVALRKTNGKIFCGGTLISDRHVLTAAHCLPMNTLMLRFSTFVILAEHDINDSTESRMVTRRIAEAKKHPNFESNSMDNDVALILLSSPVKFNSQLSPACLPSPGDDYAGYKGIVAGWGRQSEKGKPSPLLRAVELPILSQDVCWSSTKYGKSRVTDHMMCAGNIEGGGIDSCQGDSGGALVVTDRTDRYVTAGIVSWGEGCARPRRPGVYTRVNHYLYWIQQNTRDACFCT